MASSSIGHTSDYTQDDLSTPQTQPAAAAASNSKFDPTMDPLKVRPNQKEEYLKKFASLSDTEKSDIHKHEMSFIARCEHT